MNRLLIINNKGGNSTVLNALVKYIKEYFDEVAVATPKINTSNQIKEFENIKVLEVSLTNNIFGLFSSIIALITDKYIYLDFKKAYKQKKLNFKFLKTYFSLLVRGKTLYNLAYKYVKRNPTNVIMSTWFSSNAYAASLIKRKFKNILTISYAHSYEVDFRKNDYVGLLQDDFKLKMLNNVFFISENVMNEFKELNNINEEYISKIESIHFGSEKIYNGLCSISKDDFFRILTCSGVSKVKRLSLIVEALRRYDGPKIEWVHIGDGAMFDEIVKEASAINNPCVNVVFKGSLLNRDVHKYYIENPVDLFVNVSASEGLPVSIMEAMSYGIPVLATNVGGNSEIVNEKNGWIVSDKISSSELSNMLRMIASDRLTDCKRKYAYNTWENYYKLNKNIELLVNKIRKV